MHYLGTYVLEIAFRKVCRNEQICHLISLTMVECHARQE